jgi:hypothetical protein
MADGKVSFRWKDYRREGRSKVMTLDAAEFMRRFLLHVLPPGFHRIRHFGFMANGHRAARLARCRRLLAEQAAMDKRPVQRSAQAAYNHTPTFCHDYDTCPCCGGVLRAASALPRAPPQSEIEATMKPIPAGPIIARAARSRDNPAAGHPPDAVAIIWRVL